MLLLVLGDAAIFALVTVIGFANHSELNSGILRMMATFLPLCAAWALIGPWLHVFDLADTFQWHRLWRPFLAMLLAAPMAAWLRGMWLGETIPPIFVLVIGAFSGLGILLWRSIWWTIFRTWVNTAKNPELRSQGEIHHG